MATSLERARNHFPNRPGRFSDGHSVSYGPDALGAAVPAGHSMGLGLELGGQRVGLGLGHLSRNLYRAASDGADGRAAVFGRAGSCVAALQSNSSHRGGRGGSSFMNHPVVPALLLFCWTALAA